MGQVFRDLRTRGCTRAAPHVNEVTLDDVVPTLDGDGRHFQGMNDWSNRIDERALPDALRAILTEAIDTLPADYERPWSCTTSRGVDARHRRDPRRRHAGGEIAHAPPRWHE
jgi:hypothetical protein